MVTDSVWITSAPSVKSSNSKVVKVNSKGKIMALKKGTAIITVTAKSGKKDTIKIVKKAVEKLQDYLLDFEDYTI